MKKISDWAKVLLPLVGSGMVLHYLFLWHERRHAVVPHKEVYHKPHHQGGKHYDCTMPLPVRPKESCQHG